MQKPEGCEWGIYFDPVHIVTVNYARREARLFENGGYGEGKLLFKKDEPAARVSVNDPFQLMNLAIHFVISYDLLAQLADEEALAFFEQIGIKDFLERLATTTTEVDRRHRFNGLGPKFTSFGREMKSGWQSPVPSPSKPAEPPPAPEPKPENPPPSATQTKPEEQGQVVAETKQAEQPSTPPAPTEGKKRGRKPGTSTGLN